MNETEVYKKNVQKFEESKNLQMMGLKATVFDNSMGINPITLEYQQNMKGQRAKNDELDKQAQQYARTKRLQDCSTNKYNIINGGSLVEVQNYVPSDCQRKYT